MVDDFSSKLGLPQSLETVESINANHMQMARCSKKSDELYRAMVGILTAFLGDSQLDSDKARTQPARVAIAIDDVQPPASGTGTGEGEFPS